MKTQVQKVKERLEKWREPIARRLEQAVSETALPDIHEEDHDHGDEPADTTKKLPAGARPPRVTSGFGTRVSPVDGVRRMHYGVDIGAGKGPTYAVADGYILHAGPAGTAGNMVVIHRKGSDGSGHQYRYLHLDSISVTQGQRVKKGDLIGTMGETGRAKGVHLHLEHLILIPAGGKFQKMHIPPTAEEINAAVPGAIKGK